MFGVQQQRRGQRPDRGDLISQRLLRRGVDGQIQTEAEQFALAARNTGREIVGVLGGRFHVRVGQSAVLGGVPPTTLQFGQLPFETGGGGGGVDRLDVQRHIQPAGIGQQGLQPAGMDLTRIAHDGEGGDPLAADFQMPGTHAHRIRRERTGGRRCDRSLAGAMACTQHHATRPLSSNSSSSSSVS